MAWRYRIEGTKNISTFSTRAEAVKKAGAKLRTQPCGREIVIWKVWHSPSGVVSFNKKGSRVIWREEKPCSR